MARAVACLCKRLRFAVALVWIGFRPLLAMRGIESAIRWFASAAVAMPARARFACRAQDCCGVALAARDIIMGTLASICRPVMTASCWPNLNMPWAIAWAAFNAAGVLSSLIMVN